MITIIIIIIWTINIEHLFFHNIIINNTQNTYHNLNNIEYKNVVITSDSNEYEYYSEYKKNTNTISNSIINNNNIINNAIKYENTYIKNDNNNLYNPVNQTDYGYKQTNITNRVTKPVSKLDNNAKLAIINKKNHGFKISNSDISIKKKELFNEYPWKQYEDKYYLIELNIPLPTTQTTQTT